MQKIYLHFRNYFFSGLLLVVPLVITILVIKAIFTFLDTLLLPFIKPYFTYWIPGLGILITFLAIYLVGLMVANYFGRKLVLKGEQYLLRIPFAKSIYGSVKQILETVSTKDQQSAKMVIMFEYPKENVWSIGLVNGEILHPETADSLYNVLIIASINPASGFFVLVPKNAAIELQISVEDAMKWIVSGGIVTPQSMKDHLKSKQ